MPSSSPCWAASAWPYPQPGPRLTLPVPALTPSSSWRPLSQQDAHNPAIPSNRPSPPATAGGHHLRHRRPAHRRHPLWRHPLGFSLDHETPAGTGTQGRPALHPRSWRPGGRLECSRRTQAPPATPPTIRTRDSYVGRAGRRAVAVGRAWSCPARRYSFAGGPAVDSRHPEGQIPADASPAQAEFATPGRGPAGRRTPRASSCRPPVSRPGRPGAPRVQVTTSDGRYPGRCHRRGAGAHPGLGRHGHQQRPGIPGHPGAAPPLRPGDAGRA